MDLFLCEHGSVEWNDEEENVQVEQPLDESPGVLPLVVNDLLDRVLVVELHLVGVFAVDHLGQNVVVQLKVVLGDHLLANDKNSEVDERVLYLVQVFTSSFLSFLPTLLLDYAVAQFLLDVVRVF